MVSRDRAFAGVLLALLVVGCAQTRLSEGAVQFVSAPSPQTASPPPQRIIGLRERFASLSGLEGQLRVLVVNGMATDAHGYSFLTQSDIAQALGQPFCQSDIVIDLDRPRYTLGPEGGATEEFPPATLRITAWSSRERDTARLIFYEILWTPYADEVTDRFLARFETDVRFAFNPTWAACEGEPRRPSRDDRRASDRERQPRAFFNAIIKDDVMVAGMTDAVLSVGPLGAAARDAIRQGLCIMAADALEAPRRDPADPRCQLTQDTLDRFGSARAVGDHLDSHAFAMLTYSLGSFLLLDALDEFRLWPEDLGSPDLTCEIMPALLNDTPVYMFSNQVSLLVTAHPQFGCDPETNCTIHALVGGRRVLLRDPRDRGLSIAPENACRTRTSMQVIAFNDPNDIMGYRLPDYLAEAPLVGSVVNVRVRNPAFWIPGVLANPVAAHSNHGRNPVVRRIMIEGWTP